MASDHATARYKKYYSRLLQLYPKPFRERFGEGMEQTFNDILRERKDGEKGLLGCALWVFVETSVGILKENRRSMSTLNRNILRVGLATVCILMIPLVAMQFTNEVDWSGADFIIMGILLFGSGLTYLLIARMSDNIAYRVAVGVAVGAGLALIWLNLAVGLIGSEDNPANLLYLWVLSIGVIGAGLARFQSRGMARTLFATAFAQALVPVIALIIWKPPFADPPGLVGVFTLNWFFVMLFVVSALLFRHAGSADPT